MPDDAAIPLRDESAPADAVDTRDAWPIVVEGLARRLQRQTHTLYVRPAVVLEARPELLRLGYVEEFTRRSVDERFRGVFEAELLRETNRRVRVEVVLVEDDLGPIASEVEREARRTRPARPAPPLAPVATPAPEAPRPPARRFPTGTFESFVRGPSNELAFRACQRVGEEPGGHYNPLVLCGPPGVGKSHLARAVARELVRRGLRTVSVTSEQFTNQFVQALRNRTGDAFRHRYRTALDALVIDDVQLLAGRPRTAEELCHTLDALRHTGRQAVCVSDVAPRELAGLDTRLRSHLAWGLVVPLERPGRDTRVALLREKARALGLALDEGAVAFLADSLQGSVRELEGALLRLEAGSGGRSRVDEQAARTLLAPVLASSALRPDPDRVVAACATRFSVTADDLCGPSRRREVARARHVAMFLCRERLGLAYKRIGELFGGRDHTTVMSAVKAMGEQLSGDGELARTLAEVEAGLGLERPKAP